MKFIMPRFLVNIERWKWNDEYRIYVSNTGRFKDAYKKDLPIKMNNTGYCAIRTYVGYKAAHRLVLMTWRPTRDMESLTVDHLDHNKRNNTLSNLEWVTYKENQNRSYIDQVSNDMSCPAGKVLTFGKQNYKFNTYEEAAAWVITNFMPNNKDVKKEKIANRIKNSINNNKTYCNYKWKWVNVYE